MHDHSLPPSEPESRRNIDLQASKSGAVERPALSRLSIQQAWPGPRGSLCVELGPAPCPPSEQSASPLQTGRLPGQIEAACVGSSDAWHSCGALLFGKELSPETSSVSQAKNGHDYRVEPALAAATKRDNPTSRLAELERINRVDPFGWRVSPW